MFLQRLADYADQIGLPPSMYQERPVRYIVLLAQDGRSLGIIDCASSEHKQGLRMLVPESGKRPGKSIKPFLLADIAAYVFGIAREEKEKAQTLKKHAAFIEIVKNCAQAIHEPVVQAVVQAVVHFLCSLDLSTLHLPADFDPSGRITFEVDGIRPIDLPPVRDYWVTSTTTEDIHLLQCLVCGQQRPAMKRLTVGIRGIPQGHAAGMALISANKEVYESYGLKNSLIGPTCRACGERFGNALNALLKDRQTHFNSGQLSYLFWTKEPSPFSLASLLSDTTPDEVRAFLQAHWKGRAEAARIESSPFYAAVLSAYGPRVVLRDWMEMTLGHVQHHLIRYFALQRIIDGNGKERWFPLWQLVATTIRRDSKEDAAPQVGQALLHIALHGGVLPTFLLQQVVRRVRAEHEVHDAQAACLKMVLLSQPDISWLGSITEYSH